MLSLGIEASRAFWTALASVALLSGSLPPSRAATVIARASLVKCWPRRASTTAFLCLIEAHLECPDIGLSLGERARVVAVPGDRPLEALLEPHARLPAQALADLGRVDVLAVDLARRGAGAADVGLHAR